MLAILSQLRESDSFNMVLFNSETVKWKRSASKATSDNIQAGKVFVDKRVNAGGGTNINDALLLALKLLRETANQPNSQFAGNFPMVLFLTDGDPTSGVTNTATIRANVRDANALQASIFALGFGFNLNLDFLTALSVENGGTSRRIYPGKDAKSQLEGFFDEISTPLLLRVTFQYPKDIVDVSQVTASTFSQYYDGSELVVSGKLKEGASSRLMTVNIRGNAAGSTPVTYPLSRTLHNLTVPSDKVLIEDFTERLWAYMKIKELLVKLLITEDSQERARLKSEALQMSLEYNFVTPLTSFIVVQSDSYSGNDESEVTIKFGRSPKDNSAASRSDGWKLPSNGLPILSIFIFVVRLCVY